jgi:MFS family permease
MINALIHRFLKRRHFWRYASFSEIAELYASRLMTMFALRFVLVFASVYLYRLEYSLVFIAFFWAAYYGMKAIFATPSALIAARIGPKHGLFFANVIFAVALMFLYFSAHLGISAIIVWCILQAFAGTLNNLCYQIDFSKVSHVDHAGKEIGFMNIIEKVASGLSPLIGGIIASLLGPPSAMLLSVMFFLLSAVPLLRTAEPTKTRQLLVFKGFPWSQTWRNLRANIGVGADVFTSGIAWVMFITIVVFAGDGNEIYAKIGVLASLGLIVGLTASYMYGRLIDHKQGLLLLRASVIANSLVHLLRPTITTPLGIVINNVSNDVATTGYNMAFTRGQFDTADTPGYRIVYLTLVETFANLGASIAAFMLTGLIIVFNNADGMKVFFVAMAFLTLLIATPRFALYKR